MAKSIVTAAFLVAAAAGVAAHGQDNNLVAPELSKPTPGIFGIRITQHPRARPCRGRAF